MALLVPLGGAVVALLVPLGGAVVALLVPLGGAVVALLVPLVGAVVGLVPTRTQQHGLQSQSQTNTTQLSSLFLKHIQLYLNIIC